MNISAKCPCCSNRMLHHLRNSREYWFCRQCWQEMPDLSAVENSNSVRRNKLSTHSLILAR